MRIFLKKKNYENAAIAAILGGEKNFFLEKIVARAIIFNFNGVIGVFCVKGKSL